MKERISLSKRAISIAATTGLLLLVAVTTVSAQGLTLAPTQQETPLVISGDSRIMLLIGIRLLLALTMGIAAIVAIASSYRWWTHERNDKKSYDNKRRLAKSLFVITVVFVLMTLLRYFVVDYSELVL